MDIQLMGPTTIMTEGGLIRPTAPKVRQVLALLALRAGKVVSTGTIISELWEAAPPRTAVTTVQTYVYQIRRLIDESGARIAGNKILKTVSPGYVLRLDETEVDVFRLSRLLRDARQRIEIGEMESASAALATAICMAEEVPLMDVKRGPVLQGHVAFIEEEFLSALTMRVAVEMRLGRHEELVGPLRVLAAEHPLVEFFQLSLIESLYRSGRRNDAINAYHELRSQVRDELGIDPSSEAQQLYLKMLDIGFGVNG